MTHYLIELAMQPGKSPALREDPDRFLRLASTIAERVGGSLHDGWMTDDGERIIAIFASDAEHNVDSVRDAFEGIAPEISATITPLRRLGGVLVRDRGGSVRVRSRDFVDEVDLASDLSFPASDPPSWVWEQATSTS